MKYPVLVPLIFFIIGAILFLQQLWFHAYSADIFAKLMTTDGVFFVVGLVVVFLFRENKETDKTNGENNLR